MNKTKTYMNYISLGYFCEVAKDLAIIGLRDTSSPFDWVISDFDGVIYAMESEFDGFLDYFNLKQNSLHKSHYLDSKFGIYFYHDFSKYQSLQKQYSSVREKYYRRIRRFRKKITDPTLFIRYISNETINGEPSHELKWIESNYTRIMNVIKSFNPDNEIAFIGDEDLESNQIKIYTVKRDSNDVVSRHPIINNIELMKLLKCNISDSTNKNASRYKNQQRKRSSFLYKLMNKIRNLFIKFLNREYTHNSQYHIANR